MVARTLVKDDIEQGKRLLRFLDEEGATVTSALWLFFTEAEEWRLVLALPRVRLDGPRAAYKAIQHTLEKNAVSLPISRIVVVSPDEIMIRRLPGAVRTDPNAIISIQFRNSAVGDVLVRDAHVYRST